MTPTANQNLRGKVYLTFDSSGLLKHNSYYFDGQLYEVDRRMAADYKSITDWQAITSGADPDAILTNADGLLETEVFQQQFVYNVQGQVNRYQMPKGGNTNQVYDYQGRLYRIFHRTEDSSSNNSYGEQIYFNARGQRERIRYGNNTQSWLTYDDKTFRLKRLLTTKNSDGSVLQDLNYTYDPVGNITEMTDDAQQTIFFNNTQINPTRKYTYDALYRLTAAEGREFANNNTAPGQTDAAPSVLPDNNSAALRIYDQQYTYDEMGNILQQAHNASGGSWNRYYHYAANNFLLSTSTDGTQPTIDQYTYDAHGNMLQMPHLASISWDHNDNMQEADLGGGGTAYYVYNVAGERIRKVIENGAIKEDRLYIGGRWELYRKSTGGSIDTERESVHIFDDQGARIALIDKTTIENGSPLSTPTVLNRFHLSNHLGSSNLELDSTAALISYEEYYPFGSTSYSSGRNAAETSLKRYRYVGKERDDETGLYYYGARYYASWLCRFVSVDPLKDDYPYYTPYQYAGNQPITFIDLDGAEPDLAPLAKSDNTNIQTSVDRKKARFEFDKQQQKEQSQKLANLLSGTGVGPNTPTLSAGKSKTISQVKEEQKKTRQIEAQQNYEQLKKDVYTIQGEFAYGMSQNPVIKGISGGLLVGLTAEAIGGSQVARTVLPKLKPFAERFLVDAATQSLAKTVDRFQETGKVEFRSDDIDLANSFFKASLGKLSKNNPSLVLVEESLKTIFDFNTAEGFTRKDLIDDQNEILAEFGLRLAFKFVKGGDKGDKTQQEFVLEVFKKTARNEAKENLLRDSEKKSNERP